MKLPQQFTTQIWHDFPRYDFTFEGRSAWFVAPPEPAEGMPWCWCPVWPEAFQKRVGVLDLIQSGFHYAHVDVFDTKANPQGIEIMHQFQKYMISLGLSEKVNLIGMSWGGYFSLRYAETHPKDVCAIYLDAPLCNPADSHPSSVERCAEIRKQYGMSDEELQTSPLNPLNSAHILVSENIPILAATGESDTVVCVDTNINLLEKAILGAGGKIQIIRRWAWGHHPHGLDDTDILVQFHKDARGMGQYGHAQRQGYKRRKMRASFLTEGKQ